jgi:DNA-directed RNA polymerase specialized sigma24 family protein
MEGQRPLLLVDARGVPFDDHMHEVLQTLVPRLLRQFPQLDDVVLLVEVLEEAGERVLRRQQERGPLANVYGYAWVTVRNVALTRLHAGQSQVVRHTLPPDESAQRLATLPARDATPEAIERGILLQEAFAQLSPHDRLLFAWKQAGCSSEWIAIRQGRSVAAVNTAFTRAKQRLRQLLAGAHGTEVRDGAVPWQLSADAPPRRPCSRTVPSRARLVDWLGRELRPWLVDDEL